MRLPIDTPQLMFMCAAPPRPVTDFDTEQHKADLTTGELLYNLQVVALDSEGASGTGLGLLLLIQPAGSCAVAAAEGAPASAGTSCSIPPGGAAGRPRG